MTHSGMASGCPQLTGRGNQSCMLGGLLGAQTGISEQHGGWEGPAAGGM